MKTNKELIQELTVEYFKLRKKISRLEVYLFSNLQDDFLYKVGIRGKGSVYNYIQEDSEKLEKLEQLAEQYAYMLDYAHILLKRIRYFTRIEKAGAFGNE